MLESHERASIGGPPGQMYHLTLVDGMLLYSCYVNQSHDILNPYHFFEWYFAHLGDDLHGVTYNDRSK